MDSNHKQISIPTRARGIISDAAGFVLLALSLYLGIAAGQYMGSVAFFVTGLTSFSLSRRNHRLRLVAEASRYLCVYAPTAVVLTLIAAALSDFGHHFARADFGMFYAAALQLRTDPAHLYDIEVQNSVLRAVTGVLSNHWLSFPYPPFVAALFVPLSHLPFRTAYTAMTAINVMLLAASVYLLSRTLCRTREQKQTVMLTASVLLPIHINLILGQMALVGLLLYSLFVIDILKGKPGRAGLWVALLSYKLMLVPIPLFILFIKRAWNGLLVALSGLLALLILSLVLVGADGMRANYGVIMMMTGESLISRMQSLKALTYWLGLPAGMFWLLGIMTLTAIWIMFRLGGDTRWVLAGTVLANLMVSPYVQIYDLSLSLVAIALAVSSFPHISDQKRVTLLLAAFLPGLIGVAGQVTGKNWPAVPATLLLLFCYCLYKSGVKRGEPLH